MVAERPWWAPQPIDMERPNAARVYDYMLGGGCNFEADRRFAKRFLELLPDGDRAFRANRAFLGRAVRFCVQAGIRQFLDFGSGIPTVGNVHEIAQGIAPECRIVYVDNEPVAVAHSEAILEGNDNAAVLQADLSDVDTVLGSESVARLIDFEQPVALLMVSVLHFVPEPAEPHWTVARYVRQVAPRSYLVISHGTVDGVEDVPPGSAEHYDQTSTPFHSRTRAQIIDFLAGTELVDPGMVWVSEWRPEAPEDVDDDPPRAGILCAVGHKS